MLTELRPSQVTGEAQGTDASLDTFIQHLNKGPSAARVSGVETDAMDVKQGEEGFRQK